MVYLDEDSEETEKNYSGILRLLRILLSNKVAPKKKKIILNNDFGIEMDFKFEKELNTMCNLSAGVLDKGIKIGMEKGVESSKLEDLRNIMKNLQLTFEQAANTLGISENERLKYINKI